jgi:ABC-type dipeptide/oligopeptide/nickel transport system permease component
VTLAEIDYGLYRVLQPQDYGGEGVIAGTAGDLGRIVLHFDLGDACMFYGCPAISEIWLRSWAADLYLLAGGLIIGVTAGISGAVWCATRPRSLSARVLESAATLFYVMPVYLVGFGVLLLFEPSFGAFPLPFFFHPIDYEAPLSNPWDFVRSMVVPWLVVAAPFGAVCLRLTLAAITDVLDTDYVRTARPRACRVGRSSAATRPLPPTCPCRP